MSQTAGLLYVTWIKLGAALVVCGSMYYKELGREQYQNMTHNMTNTRKVTLASKKLKHKLFSLFMYLFIYWWLI